MSRKGFTLIELLVVIAIISTLAAILFPVFSRAREKGRQTTCASNMGQIARAIEMYSTDTGGFYPKWALMATKPTPETIAGTWDVAVGSYLKSTQILTCRSNKFGSDKRAYALPRYVSGVYRDNIPNQVKTVLLVEKGGYLPGYWSDAACENVRQLGMGEPVAGFNAGYCRHNGGHNFAYCDGHVKWTPFDQGPWSWEGAGAGATRIVEFYPGVCELPGKVSKRGDWPDQE